MSSVWVIACMVFLGQGAFGKYFSKYDANEAAQFDLSVAYMRDEFQDIMKELQLIKTQMVTLKKHSHYIYLMLKQDRQQCSKQESLKLDEKQAVKHQIQPCPSGFELSREESCYRMDLDKVTWPVAKARCESLGSQLVAIETKSEQRYLIDTIQSVPSYQHCDLWTSGSDQEEEGNWVWAGHDKSVRFTNWQRHEPNNGHGGEDCMLMDWFFGWKWNDSRCNQTKACFICEYAKH